MSKETTVYIAGPMEGISLEEMTGWRIGFTGLAKVHYPGMQIKDPTRRLPFHNGASINEARKVFRADLLDIDSSGIVFLNMTRGTAKAWGTAMEAMYAWQNNKPLVIMTGESDPIHPFIESMVTVKVHNVEDGVTAVAELMDLKRYEPTIAYHTAQLSTMQQLLEGCIHPSTIH